MAVIHSHKQMRKIKRKKLKEPGDAQREVKLQFRIIEQEEFDDYNNKERNGL